MHTDYVNQPTIQDNTNHSRNKPMRTTGLIPARELRRIVAQMVD